MSRFGYIRVSTEEQNTIRQEIIMEQLNVDRVFMDKITGSRVRRPGLEEMLDAVTAGDTVIVESISRLARNTRDLLNIVDKLTEKEVEFVSQKEAIDTNTPTGRFMLTVFAAVSELEREYILARQAEGISAKKADGGYAGHYHQGRQRKQVNPALFGKLYEQYCTGEISQAEAAKKLKLSKGQINRRFRECKYVIEELGKAYNPNHILGKYKPQS